MFLLQISGWRMQFRAMAAVPKSSIHNDLREATRPSDNHEHGPAFMLPTKVLYPRHREGGSNAVEEPGVASDLGQLAAKSRNL
jgi:hypothetical protein